MRVYIVTEDFSPVDLVGSVKEGTTKYASCPHACTTNLEDADHQNNLTTRSPRSAAGLIQQISSDRRSDGKF